MQVQSSKNQLANLLLSPHDGGNVDDSLGGLHVSVALESKGKIQIGPLADMITETTVTALIGSGVKA